MGGGVGNWCLPPRGSQPHCSSFAVLLYCPRCRRQDEELDQLSTHVVRIGELGREMGQELHMQVQCRVCVCLCGWVGGSGGCSQHLTLLLPRGVAGHTAAPCNWHGGGWDAVGCRVPRAVRMCWAARTPFAARERPLLHLRLLLAQELRAREGLLLLSLFAAGPNARGPGH